VTVVVPAMSALAGTVLILGGLTACSGGAASTPSASPASGPALPTTPAAAPQKLSETGSSLMAPLFTQWGPAYHAQFPRVILSTASSSSGTGILSAAAGTTDIGASDAYLSPADVSKYANLVNIPLAVAALMVIYHVPGLSPSTHLKLNGQVLAKIYGGQITTWNDPAIRNLNPGVTLPGTAIVLVHRSDTSGSTFLFTSYMNAQDPADINYEYAIVSISQPSTTRAEDLRAFLTWAITTGTAQLAQVNFQPLPPSVVMLSQAQIAKIKG
jgi:phosphate transport system substrate-binding protein